MVEINEAKRKKEKRMKRNKDNLRDLWDNVKYPNIWIIGVPEEEDKEKRHKKILEVIIVKKFPKTFFFIKYEIISSSIFSKIGASLKDQLVKNLPAMQETLVQFLGQEDPLEKG